MHNRINITGKCERYTLPFRSSPKYINTWPIVDVVIANNRTGNNTLSLPFIIDTAASISILNIKFQDFIQREKMPIIDHLRIQYGGGAIKELPIYEVGIIIKDLNFNIKAAFDIECSYNVLGHYSFFQNLSYVVLDTVLNKTRIIKI